MAYDKQTFLKNVTILADTREQKNGHILAELERLCIPVEQKKLDFGDYSFRVGERDFSLTCVLERKASVDELYGNLTVDRQRIEKEFLAGSSIADQFTLLVEQCPSMEALESYQVPDWQMRAHGQRKVKDIGKYCYATLRSWQCGNRYHFHTLFSDRKEDSAVTILEEFYWYWRNYRLLVASRRNRGAV